MIYIITLNSLVGLYSKIVYWSLPREICTKHKIWTLNPNLDRISLVKPSHALENNATMHFLLKKKIHIWSLKFYMI
jgi:hypothetical protein